MCNDYRLEIDIASIMEDYDDLEIKIETPEGMPNVPARADIKMTDMAPIVVRLIPILRFIDPVIPGIAAKQNELEDAPVFLPRLSRPGRRLGKLG